MEDPADLELMINRFNRLVKEILQGEVRRTSFRPWEVDFLLDLHSCRLTPSRREDAVRRYQRVVQHQLERGQVPPIKLSEYLGRRTEKPAPPSGSLAGQDAAPLNP